MILNCYPIHFLKIYSKKYRKSLRGITAAALKKLMHYGWPGNVRELQHAIERAVIMTETPSLEPEDFIFPHPVRNQAILNLTPITLMKLKDGLLKK